MPIHEESEAHRQSVIYVCNHSSQSRVDEALQNQCKEREKYWIEVLRRVVAVIIFLSERGLVFRGDARIFGSKHNGNFMGCLEVIAQFDPFFAKHISEFGNAGRGTPSYLSSTIFEEIIKLIANRV